MGKISPFILLPPLVFVGLAAVFMLGLNRDDPDALPSAWVGRDAPALTTTTLGTLPELTAGDLVRREIKLVNFWASWCAPCRVEHPNLEQLAAMGVTVHGVNYKDKESNALGFLEELGNPYTKVAADVTGRTGLDWGLYGVPETFVIDESGKVLHRQAGPLTQRVMTETILPLLSANEN